MLSSRLLRAAPSLHAAGILNQTRSLSLTFRMMEEAMEHLKSNPYFDKYADKINKVKDSHPSALVSAVQKRKSEIKADASDPMASAAGVRKISSKAEKPKPTLASQYDYAPRRKLEDVMKTELLQGKSKEEITYLWTEHFKTQSAICGVMSSELHGKISKTSAVYDKFLFPLPREQGYEFIYAQFAANEIHFTPLVNFQAFGENAPECLAMIHYPELEESHGIVLMKGDFDSKIISNKEAQFLANQVQLYYTGQDERKFEILRKFHKDPAKFSHVELINELEQLDLSAMAKTKAS